MANTDERIPVYLTAEEKERIQRFMDCTSQRFMSAFFRRVILERVAAWEAQEEDRLLRRKALEAAS